MKALFVGLGSIGQRHVRNLRKLMGHSVELSAVRTRRQVPMLDENRNVIKDVDVSTYYGIDELANLDEALSQRPDVVFITNPSSMHLEVALKSASAGCHLFIEKPLHSSLEGVEELIRIVEQKKLVAMVAYQLRFHPGLKKTHAWLEDERIGQIVSAHITHGEYLPNFHPYEDYRISYAARQELGGGVLLTQIHEFDYLLWLFGKPSRVFSIGGKLSNLEIDVEDTASVVTECRRNGRAFPVSLYLDYLQSPPRRSCVITGTRGRISLDFYGTKSTVLESSESQHNETFDFIDLQVNQLFLDELEQFLQAVRGETVPVVDLRSGYESLEIALAARVSLNTGSIQSFD